MVCFNSRLKERKFNYPNATRIETHNDKQKCFYRNVRKTIKFRNIRKKNGDGLIQNIPKHNLKLLYIDTFAPKSVFSTKNDFI